jgi:hypothetical protein
METGVTQKGEGEIKKGPSRRENLQRMQRIVPQKQLLPLQPDTFHQRAHICARPCLVASFLRILQQIAV